MTSITTKFTTEEMTFAITSFSMFTNRALLRRVFWVNIDNLYPFSKSLVFNKRAELSKRPGMKKKSLFLGKFNSVPDIFQIFKDKNIIRLARVNNSFADGVVDIGHPSLLFTRQAFQEAFSPFRPFGLQRLAKTCISFTNVHNLLAREFKTIGSGSKIINASVASDRIVTRRNRNFFFKNEINIKSLFRFFINQYCRSRFLTFKKSSLKITKRKFDFQSTVNSGKRYAFFGFNKSKKVFIKVKGIAFEYFWFSLSFCTNSCNSPYNIVSSKTISFFDLIVANMVEFISIPKFLFSGDSKDVVTCLGKFRDSLKNRLSFLAINFKLAFDCFYKFHAIRNTIAFVKSQDKNLKKEEAAIPLTAKAFSPLAV